MNTINQGASSGELLQLAERIEAATGPDRELNFAIAKAVGRERWYAGGSPTWHFTASIDAAMTLVPEDADAMDLKRGPRGADEPQWRAIVWLPGRNVGYDGDGKTAPLALCAAALKARAAQGDEQ